ncbi:MAG: ABC transporter substrate-binding protein [Chloroflexota bacterium]|nr:ABC transporter substrate-binding protein [Chloroflexota bacterium]
MSRVKLFLALLLAIVLVSCASTARPGGSSAPSASRTPRSGGTLNVALSQYVSPLDMIRMTANQTTLAAIMYETLYDQKADGGVVPGLAEKTNVSSDGLTWRITLRSGVTYHDGTPFDAESVKWNLDFRKTHPTFTLKSQMAPIKAVKAVDSKTVELDLSAPTPALSVILASPLFSMESPTAYQKYPSADEYQRHAAGTGPFKLDGVPSEAQTVFVRNDAYWGPKPYLDKIVCRLIPDPSARIAALEAGDVNVAETLPDSEYARLRAEAGITVDVTQVPASQIALWFNFASPLTKQKQVRQAIAEALDRGSYRSMLKELGADPPQTIVPEQFRGAARSSTVYPYDLAKAKQLLADAGVKPGTRITVILQNTPQLYLDLGQLVKQDLDKLGFDTQLRFTDISGWLADMTLAADKSADRWQLSIAQEGGSYLDAESILFRFFPTSADAPKGSNWTHYSNAQVDQLLAQQAKTVDAAERDKLLAQIQGILWNDLSGYPLLASKVYYAHSASVHGIEAVYLRPAFLRYDAAWIDQK